MGLCQSEQDRKQAAESHEIDKRLQESKKADERVIKLLLLGTAECGKSTLMKQMRILHADGFDEDEAWQRRTIIYSNTVHAMDELLKGMRKHKLSFKDAKREDDARVVMETIKRGDESELFPAQLATSLKRLWVDPAVSTDAYALRHEFHLHESAKYFFDNVDRISAQNYMPTDTDILMARVKTTGVVQVDFMIKGYCFRVFDVGGQRSERKKWIHCFEHVNALIYIVAVSEYDQVLFEDETTNRLIESMRLFESIANSKYFSSSSIILFLNKKDLFAEKIRTVSIRTCFREYTGPQTYEAGMAHIKRKFEMLHNKPEKSLFVHHTCATDTNQVQLVIDSVILTIIDSMLHKSGVA